MKMYLLEETNRSTRLFKSFKAADKAMKERIEYYIGRQILTTKFSKYCFNGYLEGKSVVISIIEQEVEG